MPEAVLNLQQPSPPRMNTGAQNKIKNLADKAKAYVNNVSELELKVLEATNHDPWGPHGSVMQGGCRRGSRRAHEPPAPRQQRFMHKASACLCSAAAAASSQRDLLSLATRSSWLGRL